MPCKSSILMESLSSKLSWFACANGDPASEADIFEGVSGGPSRHEASSNGLLIMLRHTLPCKGVSPARHRTLPLPMLRGDAGCLVETGLKELSQLSQDPGLNCSAFRLQ